ncbi:sugar phosphate nucleotidyltransferase [Halobacteria archaeon AArc-dxtr1]|nr:sugar phosphate nucleotidyltransferase [Halobacteria archaeon AArc-dxtr1]
MQAVVPAAGEGTRLRPLTDSQPKGLVEVAGRPILTHCFDRLRTAGVDEIIVVIGYEGAQIVDYYGDSYEGTPLTYVRQVDRKGLAHAILQAEPAVDGDFLVYNGDNVFAGSLAPVLDTQSKPDVDATLLTEHTTRDVARTTGVVTTSADGTVIDITEKPADPPTTRVTTGVYALPETIFDYCRASTPANTGEYELADALTNLRHAGSTIATVSLDGWRVNVNTPADRERATQNVRTDRNQD